MAKFRVVSDGGSGYRIEEKLLFWWFYCGNADTSHWYRTKEEAIETINWWLTPKKDKVVYETGGK